MKRGSLIAAFALAAGMGLGWELSASLQPTLRGSVYAGVSPDTNRTMYATRDDAPGTYTFDQASAHCGGLDVDGQHDWRVPTKAELNVLFNSHAAIGGFDQSGSPHAGWYWSSTEDDRSYAWVQRFSDGLKGWSGKVNDSSLRCVR
jgi:hypothetical protein